MTATEDQSSPISAAGANDDRPATVRRPLAAEAGVFLLLLVGLFAIYSGVLLIRYAYLDDYSWLETVNRFPTHVFKMLAALGRPVNAWVLKWAMRRAGGIRGLWKVRAMTLVGMALVAWTFHRALSRAGWGRERSALLALIACTVPAFQVYAAWAPGAPIPLGGAMAVAAGIVAARAADDPRARRLGFVTASFLVFGAAINYQPIAMLFWPAVAADLFRPGGQAGRAFRRAIAYGLVAASGLFLAWLVFKWGTAHYPRWVGTERAGFTHDVRGKAHDFVQFPLAESLNFLNLYPSAAAAWVVGLAIAVGLLVYFPGVALERSGLLVLAAALLPLAYLPNLVAVDRWTAYRTQVGVEWMVLLYAWLAIDGYWRLFWRLLNFQSSDRQIPLFVVRAAAVAFGAVAAYEVTAYFAMPQATELTLCKLRLSELPLARVQRIIVLQPGIDDTTAPGRRYDEFGGVSLAAHYVPGPMIYFLMRDMDEHAQRIHVQTEPDFKGPWTQPLPAGTYVLDLRRLRDARWSP